MNHSQFILCVCLLLIISSCCPSTSIHPLSSLEQGKYDERLEGTWIQKSDSGEIGYLHVGKKEGNLAIAITTEVKKSGELDYAVFTFFSTMIDGQQYLNIKANELGGDLPPKEWGYIFARYKFEENDVLSVFYMDPNQFAHAITSGKLKGKISYAKRSTPAKKNIDQQGKNKDIDCIQLTDTSDNIFNFIKYNAPEILFPEGLQFKIVRSKKD